VTPATAAGLSARMAGGPLRVGLFVEPTSASIAQVLDRVKLDALQIYGALADLPMLGARFGLPIWRAVGVATLADLPADPLGASALVVEAAPPAGATRPGGNATVFDWSVLHQWVAPVPWVLAGGLTPGNVAAAIKATGAEAVDVSSGVESSKGVKDAALIRDFIAAAKRAGRSMGSQ
jgi:phosphoribosylanthranilate isomerase